MSTPSDAQVLLHEPLDSLLSEASKRRDGLFGTRITYSRKVFIPLTMLCRDRCGYCTFAKAPARVTSPFLNRDEVLDIARAGRAAGCHEALFTLGEAPEQRYPQAAQWLEDNGYGSTVDYLIAMCEMVRDETGLLPHANPGALDGEDLRRLREVSASQGMMIESLSEALHQFGGAHYNCPDKLPDRRLETLHAAGRAHIPFTTGILVGIGETWTDRIAALSAIAEAHERFGHVQEVIVQNFLPKPGTKMAKAKPFDGEDYLRIIAAARLLLPATVHLQAPPNLSADPGMLIDAGVDDWGGVSPVTSDHVNPERPWPAVQELESAARARGKELVPRLTTYPEFVLDPARWIAPTMRPVVLRSSDATGLARDDEWFSGGDAAPPILIPRPRGRIGGRIAEVLHGVEQGQRVGFDEIVALLDARGDEVVAVAELADQLREQVVGDDITFVRNRNINYTNVCTFKCKFCAFSKGPLSLNLRGTPYLLELEEIQQRVLEAEQTGATEVCLQGGIHPSFDGDYYLSVIKAVKEAAPTMHIHGFTALEVHEGARRLGVDLGTYLQALKDAGLATIPGTAAEILDDEVRAIICPDKINTAEWLEVHRTAHRLGIGSNITIMFGHVEESRHIASHLLAARSLQEETGGFSEVVPLPFVHMATPIYLQQRSRRGPTFREALLIHAVSRIAMHGLIDNIQVSWVKLGVLGARQALQAGANDVGGTLMDENISRAAGAEHGQLLDDDMIAQIGAPLGRPMVQRNTRYGRVTTRNLARFEHSTAEPVTLLPTRHS
ncbi:MAG: 5-amino-6-(D-ribitylamino)uracil--L-tyrosine 4-hydroxyphenyl transferase CofH [Actinobacteria bacterium]|nr:5-amino-6-(D-ribitylamino)uracil--L-tyrosine 4-hydroxyphenyl transferase CofH [Actinomycetota bacterium]MCB9388772.1 5-amino-6-(D-ribitylamino)uracil--L-tyrosine 4-hydroxyphenyl transferase CofH [Acidimicrobiia bacterium]